MAGFVRGTVLALATIGLTTALEKHDLQSLHGEYDYVVVGGGVSGLVVANRLSEDPKKTVLVVEYGDIANTPNASVPGLVLSTDQSARTWAFPSSPQTHLSNRTAYLPLGSVVGGGSVINGMAYTRGSAIDYDSWGALGNSGWNWQALWQYFRKSTTFDPPAEEFVARYGFEWTPEAYDNGPVQVGFPSWLWPGAKLEAKAWTEDLDEAYSVEGANGNHTGLIWTAQTVSSTTGTRSSAETAYYHPVSNRTNLHLLVRHFGAKIEFESNSTTASGVQLRSRDSASDTRLISSSNVIVATGAINTPRLLQLSGIGPAKLLNSLDIDVIVDAPGVGANFQDHPAMYLSFNYDNDTILLPSAMQDPAFNAAAWENYTTNKTGPFTAGLTGRIVFSSLQDLDSDYESLAANLSSPSHLTSLPSIYASSPALTKGYAKQLSVLQTQFLSPQAGVAEFASSGGGAITISLQKPLSRGTVHIKSSNPDPSEPPVIDFNAGANPTDMHVAVKAIRKARELVASESLSTLNPSELVPGAEFETDEELEGVMRDSLYGPSFAHPAGTAAMMPKELGGVVGADLRVYGVEGVWVVDASVIPILPAGHISATVYAVAEYAADMIKGHAKR